MAFIPSPKSEYELEAAWTVAAALSGVPARRDAAGAPPGTHDYDIHLPDGSIIALEVTSRVVAEVASFWRDMRDSPIHAPDLELTWNIQVCHPTGSPQDPRTKDLRKRLPTLLKIIQAHVTPDCVDAMLIADSVRGTPAEAALIELRGLGVTVANPLPRYAGFPAQVSVGTGGFLRNDSIESVISEAVAANAAKLLRATADARHLFLWVDTTDQSNWPRLFLGQDLPNGPPYASGIDLIWVALWSPGHSKESWAARLWTISPQGSWSTLPVPLVRQHAQLLIERRTTASDSP